MTSLTHKTVWPSTPQTQKSTMHARLTMPARLTTPVVQLDEGTIPDAGDDDWVDGMMLKPTMKKWKARSAEMGLMMVRWWMGIGRDMRRWRVFRSIIIIISGSLPVVLLRLLRT
jgi:hypothetical protein